MSKITAAKLAQLVGGILTGDGNKELCSVAPLDSAEIDSISFLANARYARMLDATRAGVVLVGRGVSRQNGDYIVTDDPYSAFVIALEYFNPVDVETPGIHPTAVVASESSIDSSACIGPNCVIESGVSIGSGTVLAANVFVGRNSRVGANCHVHPNVSIRNGCVLGDRVVIHCGTVIGSDGFGFAMEQGRFRKIPQIGNVVIENDVEIGANTTIDRATMGETRICEGTKIDNLVQIAHNVRIGRHCVIAAQAGISGSTQFGDYCRVGGQAGFIGHIKIGDGAAFGAQSGISADVSPGEILSGSPARPHSLWKRMEAALPRLPELLRRVKRIEEQLGLHQPMKEGNGER